MLSFEISAIDIVLVVAVMALLLLYIAQRKGQTPTQPQFPVNDRETAFEKTEATDKALAQQPSAVEPSLGFQKCIHNFGYLKNQPKGTSIPDECFGCPKVLRCLFPNEEDR